MSLHVPDVVWAIINFLVLLVILTKFLYKPLLGVLEKREEEIRTNLENAENAKNDALIMKESYEKEMQDAKKQAQDILDNANKLGAESKDQIIQQAREEADVIIEKAQTIVRQEKEDALSQLRDEVSSLVVMAAGKVIDKSINEKDHEKLIKDFIQEVGDVS